MNSAFIFPGQGAQSVGMLDQICQAYPDATQRFLQKASAYADFDIWQLVHEGPDSLLNQTEYTQVTMLVADVLFFQLLAQNLSEEKPQVMAGHSLGEYAALVCSGALSLEQGIKIVRYRGQLMQETIPLGEGAMAAIVGLGNETVSMLCEQVSDEKLQVSPANYNAPGQVVVAGHYPAVERLIELAEAQDARLAKMIPVSVPCHCLLLKGAAQKFQNYLNQFEFAKPQVPVLANINAQPYQDIEQIRAWLTQQLYSPVQWVDSIHNMTQTWSIDTMVEVGPGNVLIGLVKRIDRSISLHTASSLLSKHRS